MVILYLCYYIIRLIKFCKDNGGCTGDYNVPDDDVDEDNNCNAESKPEGSVSNNGNNSDAEDDDDNALLRRLQSLGLDASSTSAGILHVFLTKFIQSYS